MKIGMSSASVVDKVDNGDTNERIWTEDPMVLLSLKSGGHSLYPSKDQSYTERLNSATRLVIGMSIFFALFVSGTRRIFTLLVGGLTLLSISLLADGRLGLESFVTSSSESVFSEEGGTEVSSAYDPDLAKSLGCNPEVKQWRVPTEANPYGNLLPGDDFERLPAPPAYNPEIRDEIVRKYKAGMGLIDPADLDKESNLGRLYGDVSMELSLAQAERTYYSNASTTAVPGEGLMCMMGDPGKWKSLEYV
jgi:hypothetical protein